ncbi:radical SAM protein [Paenibacillus lautus]|uniref:radical SAM protein n=1 Tax=Paenibacillus lautus TaxID=1401 RepID=UPI003D28A9AC
MDNIFVKSLELHASYHCNLKCRGCMHLSPLETPGFIDIDEIIDTLTELKKYLRTDTIRILGGEPLLNKNILDVVYKVKSVGIADKVSLTTNGTLLSKADPKIWGLLDEVEISNYKYSKGFIEKLIDDCKKITANNNIRISIYNFESFREPFSEIKNSDIQLVKDIYNNCLFAREWQCFNVFEGYFFKCPQAFALSRKLSCGDYNANGIRILENSNLHEQLVEYIDSSEPLPSCHHCLGSVGKRFDIQQVEKPKWMSCQSADVPSLLDYNFLEESRSKGLQNVEINTVGTTVILHKGEEVDVI